MGKLTERLLKASHEENCCCEECKCEEHKENLSEEEIERIINEKYSEKDDKTKEFIRRGLRRWGNQYDYSPTTYIRASKVVEICCRIHGNFKRTASNFLSKKTICGCNICSIESRTKKNKKSTELFIQQANLRFGEGKFDYSRVNYVNTEIKVEIICPIHGSFFVKPRLFLSPREDNYGCPYCGRYSARRKISNNKERFIMLSNQKFGENKFEFDETDYINITTPVMINCKIHGEFLRTPKSFLASTCGCPECSRVSKSRSLLLEKETFINRAREVHGESYCYDEVDYKGLRVPIKIFDIQRNEYFYQTPRQHLRGSGNPNRTMSSGEQAILNWLVQFGYNYKAQLLIDDVLQIGTIRVDFCLYLNDNTKVFIEYNGRQHYESVPFFETNRSFSEQVKRDTVLRDYCMQNDIKLIVIPYTISGNKPISDFLTKTIIEGIDPHMLIDYDALYVVENNNNST